MSLNFCDLGGFVVAPPAPVPVDPSDYKTGPLRLGCSRLRCQSCGAQVNSQAGIDCPDVADHLEELAGAADWTTLSCVRPFAPGRLYACRCLGWLETSMHACDPPDPDESAGDPTLPWRCEGHPPAVLPIVVDGERISVDTDFDALVDRVLGGWSPPESPAPCPWMPTVWLYRLRRWLAPLPESDTLARAVARRLVDPVRRGGALAYFCGFPRDPGFEMVLALGTTADALFERSQSQVAGGSGVEYWPAWALRCRLFSVRGDPDAFDQIALQLLEDALLRGDARLDAEDLNAIATADGPWLAHNAAAIARAAPSRTLAVLESLRSRGRPELVVVAGVALAGEPAADRTALRRWLNEWFVRYEPYAPVIALALDGSKA